MANDKQLTQINLETTNAKEIAYANLLKNINEFIALPVPNIRQDLQTMCQKVINNLKKTIDKIEQTKEKGDLAHALKLLGKVFEAAKTTINSLVEVESANKLILGTKPDDVEQTAEQENKSEITLTNSEETLYEEKLAIAQKMIQESLHNNVVIHNVLLQKCVELKESEKIAAAIKVLDFLIGKIKSEKSTEQMHEAKSIKLAYDKSIKTLKSRTEHLSSQYQQYVIQQTDKINSLKNSGNQDGSALNNMLQDLVALVDKISPHNDFYNKKVRALTSLIDLDANAIVNQFITIQAQLIKKLNSPTLTQNQRQYFLGQIKQIDRSVDELRQSSNKTTRDSLKILEKECILLIEITNLDIQFIKTTFETKYPMLLQNTNNIIDRRIFEDQKKGQEDALKKHAQLINKIDTELCRLDHSKQENGNLLVSLGLIKASNNKITAFNELKDILVKGRNGKTTLEEMREELAQWKTANAACIKQQRNKVHTLFSPGHMATSEKMMNEVLSRFDPGTQESPYKP